jgi:threonine dehydrogenase-like Zn-dependent dehydrogenase
LLLHRQLTLYASWVTSLPAMEELADSLVRWDVSPQRLVTDILPLEKADEAYRLANSGQTGKVCLVPSLT